MILNPPKVEEIIKDVKTALLKEPNIEVITITSNGEPTLYKDLDILVDRLNEIKDDKKLLILSNSSTITDPKIREVLKKIDIVKLSLDCVSQMCFKKIDRPMEGIYIKDIILGIKTFAKSFENDLVIEVLLVKGVNDKKQEIEALNRVLNEIKPTRVDFGTIDRPPAFDVNPVTSEVLKELSSSFEGLPISIIHKTKPKFKVSFDKDEIKNMLKRRPQSQSDVDYLFSDISKNNLLQLVDDKEVLKKSIAGVIFYCDTNLILSR